MAETPQDSITIPRAELAKLDVPARETGEVIAAFKSMQADVVGH